MATGLYVLQDGSVLVAYGRRQIPIPSAQYRANGYKPALEKLVTKSLTTQQIALRHLQIDIGSRRGTGKQKAYAPSFFRLRGRCYVEPIRWRSFSALESSP
jgi:hypothetical protein